VEQKYKDILESICTSEIVGKDSLPFVLKEGDYIDIIHSVIENLKINNVHLKRLH